MSRYVGGRILQALGNLIFVSTLVFVLERVTGDPTSVLLPQSASAQQIAQVRSSLGLSRSVASQYLTFLNHLLHLNLGTSFSSGQPVTTVLSQAFPATLSLCFASLLYALLIGLPLGTLGALYKGSPVDTFARSVALIGQSVPAFYMSITLVLVFSVALRALPVAGRGGPVTYILPAVALGGTAVSGIVRITRSSMLDVMDSDYIRMAYAKGLSVGTIAAKHALRNALIPLITYTGLIAGGFLGGAVTIESIFNWGGVGQTTLTAVQQRDFPVLQGAVLLVAVCFIVVNLAVDIIYVLVDPRIKVA